MRLEGDRLGCERGGREVFSRLSFAVSSGEMLAVTGQNGAGKSSLLRLIAGLVAKSAGTLTLAGGDDELTIPEQAHYLGHRDPLKPALTVLENLAFWRDFLGGEAGDAKAALGACGLGHAIDLPAGFLSAGQRRRLSIARLLTVKRPLWLIDEPTSALDTRGQAMLTEAMRTHLSHGGIIVVATHVTLPIAAAQTLHIGPLAAEVA